MKNLLILTGLVASLVFASCENNDLLLSEKKLKKEIQHTWKITTPSPTQDARETWTFSGDEVTIAFTRNSNDTTIRVKGYYSVDAKFSKAYVELKQFTFANYLNSGFQAADLNRKWTLVELKNGVLYLSATDNRGAIRSIEFEQE